jgi:hypothetical protein
MLYLPPAELSPEQKQKFPAEIPANDIVIGFTTPLYTTFILSADIVADLGQQLHITLGKLTTLPPSSKLKEPVIGCSPILPAPKKNSLTSYCMLIH